MRSALDYWIGRTFAWEAYHRTVPKPSGIHLRELTPADLAQIKHAADPRLQTRTAEPGPYIRRYGAFLGGTLVGVCTFQFGEEYRGYYTLAPHEAELTDIYTAAASRGKGVAVALIQYGADSMWRIGFRRLYAKVWHSNHPSTKAFLRAGWTKESFFVRVQIGRLRPISLRWQYLTDSLSPRL
jgi:RimJ/RimL family protein N-acetyltransferase